MAQLTYAQTQPQNQTLPAAGQSTGAGIAGSSPSGQSVELQEVTVTAQKRSESIDTVPMSIVAASGDRLKQLGITGVRDLDKLVPGFSYSDSQNGTPVYTLRGIGFNDTSLGGRPTVSIYSDEAPIPFSSETLGSQLDIERVEVLKGPQGTLFGQNATGGAINYIAAKPTSYFTSGLDASYGNYDNADISGFISGPLTDTLNARLAVDDNYRGDWQRSYTSGATLGAGNFVTARLLLAWQPIDELSVQLNVNGYHDGRETQAPQLIAVTPNVPGSLAYLPTLLNYPHSPANDRSADWDSSVDYHRDNTFTQANLRLDYELPSSLTLTSLTSYSRFDDEQPYQNTGDSLPGYTDESGHINTLFQELRVSGSVLSHGKFIIGGNFERDRAYQSDLEHLLGDTIGYSFVPLGLPVFADFREYTDQRTTSSAVFANLDYDVADRIKIYGGARYTRADSDFFGCSADAGDGIADSVFAPFYNFVRGQFGLPPNAPSPLGACLTASSTYVPTQAVYSLDQSNVSWRIGADWSPLERTLLYANVSRGYKAGGFPDLGATAVAQYLPAVQEAVTAYETGFKLNLVDRTLQLDGAIFDYDYTNKQILGYFVDPVFGPINRLVNIPHSNLRGAELQVDWLPLRGLTLGASGSYIDSRILDNFTSVNANGALQDFGNEPFPSTPKWQALARVDYQFPIGGALIGFVGADARHSSPTNSQLGELAITTVKAYTLVDVRTGVESEDGAWRVSLWGRNVGNTYYWTSAYRNDDTVVRYAGMPATYGVSVTYRFK